jgi:hypothetical protein
MTAFIGRREVIALLGGAAAAWPLAARAAAGDAGDRRPPYHRRERCGWAGPQHGVSARAATIGLHRWPQRFGSDRSHRPRNARTGCAGTRAPSTCQTRRNVRIETRWSADADRIRSYVAELVSVAPDAILASGSATVGPLLQATRSLPIVFTNVPDPVGAGFVNSLARPGGNATGFILLEYATGAKWLELLKQIAPGVTRAAVLRDPAITAGIGYFGAIQAGSISDASRTLTGATSTPSEARSQPSRAVRTAAWS